VASIPGLTAMGRIMLPVITMSPFFEESPIVFIRKGEPDQYSSKKRGCLTIFPVQLICRFLGLVSVFYLEKILFSKRAVPPLKCSF
jgi:hypothetical protein